MDFLKSIINEEISKKKKEIEEIKKGKNDKKKFIRRGELENYEKRKYLEEIEKEEKERENKKRRKLEKERKESSNSKNSKNQKGDKDHKGEIDDNNTNNNDENIKGNEEGDSGTTNIFENISAEEVTRRLRSHGEPIRYFGETDQERIIRLRHCESTEEKTEGQRNEFMHALEDTDRTLDLDALKKQAGFEDDSKKQKNDYSNVDTTCIGLELLQKDIDKAYFLLFVFFKRMINEWEEDLDKRDEKVKRSYEGKREAAIERQTAEYLKPFFKELKKKTIQADVLARVSEIAQFMQEREYMKANESYLQLSIGNAPWPIGVTMVGIHERSGKIK